MVYGSSLVCKPCFICRQASYPSVKWVGVTQLVLPQPIGLCRPHRQTGVYTMGGILGSSYDGLPYPAADLARDRVRMRGGEDKGPDDRHAVA